MKKFTSMLLMILLTLSCICTCFGAESSNLWSNELFTFGTVEGMTYKNEMLGYGVEVPEGWTFADEETIAGMNQIGEGLLSEEIQDTLKNAPTIIDMTAASSDSTQNIQVAFNNTMKNYGVSLEGIEVEDLIDMSLLGMQQVPEQMGMTDGTVEKTSYTFAGDTLPGIKVSGKLLGLDMYVDMIMIKPLNSNDYIAAISATCIGVDGGEELLSSFFKLS